jgi:uncharacterized protein YdhG (YjbR/CyaY superfamily)
MKNLKAKSVDAYIAAQDVDKLGMLNSIRSLIRSMIPDAEELISYQIPCYKHFGLVVGFGANKAGCSFYTMSTTILKEYSNELKEYKYSGSTLHINRDQKLPQSVLKKIIKQRYRHNEKREADRKK